MSAAGTAESRRLVFLEKWGFAAKPLLCLSFQPAVAGPQQQHRSSSSAAAQEQHRRNSTGASASTSATEQEQQHYWHVGTSATAQEQYTAAANGLSDERRCDCQARASFCVGEKGERIERDMASCCRGRRGATKDCSLEGFGGGLRGTWLHMASWPTCFQLGRAHVRQVR